MSKKRKHGTATIDDLDSPDEPGPSGSNGSRGGVTLKPPSGKRIARAKNWFFTWNLTKDQVGPMGPDFHEMLDQVADKYAIQLEKGEESGLLHWQGNITFKEKCRPKGKFGFPDTVHWEKTRNVKWAEQYCLKTDTAMGQVFVKGVRKRRELQKVTFKMLRPWQQQVAKRFEEIPDMFDRTIHWFWEPTGNIGKTVLGKYFVDQCDALVLGGKGADCKYGVQQYVHKHEEGPPIIIINVPRSVMGYVSYQAIEEVKDAMFFSGKYEGGMVRYNTPHVIIFANEEPDVSKMSADRWNIQNLSESINIE